MNRKEEGWTKPNHTCSGTGGLEPNQKDIIRNFRFGLAEVFGSSKVWINKSNDNIYHDYQGKAWLSNDP